MATMAPASASVRANSRPSRPAPPVTMAVLCSRRNDSKLIGRSLPPNDASAPRQILELTGEAEGSRGEAGLLPTAQNGPSDLDLSVAVRLLVQPWRGSPAPAARPPRLLTPDTVAGAIA